MPPLLLLARHRSTSRRLLCSMMSDLNFMNEHKIRRRYVCKAAMTQAKIMEKAERGLQRIQGGM